MKFHFDSTRLFWLSDFCCVWVYKDQNAHLVCCRFTTEKFIKGKLKIITLIHVITRAIVFYIMTLFHQFHIPFAGWRFIFFGRQLCYQRFATGLDHHTTDNFTGRSFRLILKCMVLFKVLHLNSSLSNMFGQV